MIPIKKLFKNDCQPLKNGHVKKCLAIVAILSLVFSPVTPVFAATRTWLGLSPFGDEMSRLANWWFGVPDDWDSLEFSTRINGRANPWNDFVGYTFSGITFKNSAKATDLEGNSINLYGDIDNSSSNSQIIGLDINLQKDADLYSGDSSYNLELGGIVSGGYSISKNGTSILILSGANTYTGATTVSEGTLQLGAAGVIPDSSAVTLSSGATFSLNGYNETIGSLSGSGNVNNNSATNATLTAGDTTSKTFSGTLVNGSSGKLALTKQGSGTLVLTGTNTYTGTTTISAGTLQIGNNGTTGSLSTGSAITNNGTLSFYRTNTMTQGTDFASAIGGTGVVKQEGSGTLVLTGTNTYTGTTTISAGTLQIGNNGTTGSLSTSSAITNNGTLSFYRTNTITQGTDFASAIGGTGVVKQEGSGTLVLTGTNTYTGATTITSGTLTLDATGTIAASAGVANSGTFIIGNNKTIGYLTGAGAATLGVNTLTITGTGIYSGIASGTGGLTMNGAGKTLTLSGGNAYSGGTTITAGVVSATTSADALGTGAVTVANGAALQVTGALDFNEALTIRGTGVSSGGALQHISGNTTYSGDITLAAASRINSDAGTLILSGAAMNDAVGLTIGGAGNTTISKAITTGANTLTKDGSGTLTLSGANTYSGATTISAGTLTLDYSSENNSKISETAALTLGGGTLNLSGGTYTQAVASTILSSGHSLVIRSSGTAVLQMKAITVSEGATIDFSAASIAKTDNDNSLVTGTLGTWATINGTDWAKKDAGAGDNGFIIAFNNYADINAYGGIIANGANQVRIQFQGTSGDITLNAADTTINTLLQNTGYDATVDTTNKILRTDGIMIGEGKGALTIGLAGVAGTLTSTTSGGGLELINYSNDELLTVNAVIADYDGLASSSLTKSGDGTVNLNGVNTYTGDTTINAGTLNLRQSLTSSSELIFSGDATVNLASGKNLGCDVTTEDNGTGTLNFLGGTQTVDGDIGETGMALNEVSVASGNTTFNGDVIATTLYFSGDGTAILSSGKSITGDVRANGSYIPQGTLTLAGGNQTISGMIGSAQDILKAVNVQTGTGGTATFSSSVRVQNVYITGTGTAAFEGNVLDTDINFSAEGFATLKSGFGLTGNVTGSSGIGTFTLLGEHTITGNMGSTLLGNTGLKLLTVGNGAVTINGNVRAVTTNFAGDNELEIGSGYGITGLVTSSNDGTGGTLTFLGSTSTGGDIGATGKALKVVNFNGATTLSDDIFATNTYIKTGSTVTMSGNSAITGNLTLNNTSGCVLDLGLNTLTVTGNYTQNDNSKLKLRLSDADFGRISAGSATISGSSVLDIDVTGLLNGNTFTIVDGAAAGSLVVPTTIIVDSPLFTVTATADANDLVLNVVRGTTYEEAALNPNAAAVGHALDTAPTLGDMETVKGQIDSLSGRQAVTTALDSMTPDVSSGQAEASRALTGQGFTSIGNRLGGARNGGASSGISSGDTLDGVGVWMQALGSDMHQDTRKGIGGYNADLFGTTVGADKVLDDHFRAGFAGNFGFARVKSKAAGSPSDDINSYQATVYGSFDSLNLNKARQSGKKSYQAVRSQVENSWYVDGMFAFTQNNYDSRREIWPTSMNKRVAKADHYGQQYSTNFETGYKFVFKETKALEVTPFMSLGYNYLYMNSYKEKGADALNLSVQGEGFSQLEQGLGTKLAYPILTQKLGTFIPSAKAAWLYDYIRDRFETTASFAGGGSAFKTQGAKPARSGMLVGAELAFLNKGNMTVSGNWDMELKDQFMSNTYYGTVRYDF